MILKVFDSSIKLHYVFDMVGEMIEEGEIPSFNEKPSKYPTIKYPGEVLYSTFKKGCSRKREYIVEVLC